MQHFTGQGEVTNPGGGFSKTSAPRWVGTEADTGPWPLAGAWTDWRNHLSSDDQKHQELLNALRASQGERDGSFDEAVTRAFQHVFEHLGRLNLHVSVGGPEGEDRHLKAGESPTLR